MQHKDLIFNQFKCDCVLMSFEIKGEGGIFDFFFLVCMHVPAHLNSFEVLSVTQNFLCIILCLNL